MNNMLFDKDGIRKYQQSLMGLVFLVITPLSVLPGIFFHGFNPVGWWHSVSQTYYSNTGIVMISFFMVIGIIGITFRARNIIEKLLMLFLGFGCIGVLLFPHALNETDPAGFFMIPGGMCTVLHFIFAGICFLSICWLSFLFAFISEETEKKHQRNVLYLSNWAIIGICGIVVALTKTGKLPEWTVLVMEFIMFSLFGADLLCCAGKISFLR